VATSRERCASVARSSAAFAAMLLLADRGGRIDKGKELGLSFAIRRWIKMLIAKQEMEAD